MKNEICSSNDDDEHELFIINITYYFYDMRLQITLLECFALLASCAKTPIDKIVHTE